MSGKSASTRARRAERLERPAYSMAEAARLLGMSKATLRSWIVGRPYPTRQGRRSSEPLIRTPEGGSLSFLNLVEAHVLDALRRTHGISMQEIRRALQFVAGKLGSARPLLDREFETDGVELFVEHYGALVSVSREGQTAMREALRARLRRVERDVSGVPVRLYPFTRDPEREDLRRVVIDPEVQFGRPVPVGTGIPIEVIASRFKAGESMGELARDYGREPDEIEEAIRAKVRSRPAAVASLATVQ